jgi:hypothetical protein
MYEFDIGYHSCFFYYSSLISIDNIDLTSSWWVFRLCLTQPFLDLNHLAQIEHSNLGLTEWLSSCCLRSDFLANFLGHSVHSNGFSPLWILWWLFKFDESFIRMPHWGHSNNIWDVFEPNNPCVLKVRVVIVRKKQELEFIRISRIVLDFFRILGTFSNYFSNLFFTFLKYFYFFYFFFFNFL